MASEHTIQVQLVARFRALYPNVVIFAIPNGGYRDKAEAARLKAEGVLSGVPDLFIAHPLGGFNGMFLELKSSKGRTSQAQELLLERLSLAGYYSVVAYGLDGAWLRIRDYMSL